MEGIQFEEDKYTSGTLYQLEEKGLSARFLNFLVKKGIATDLEMAKKITLFFLVIFAVVSLFFFFRSLGGGYEAIDTEAGYYLPADPERAY